MHFEVLDENGRFTHIKFFLNAIREAIQEKHPDAVVSFAAQENMSLSIQCSVVRFNGTIWRRDDGSFYIFRCTPGGEAQSFDLPSEFVGWALLH